VSVFDDYDFVVTPSSSRNQFWVPTGEGNRVRPQRVTYESLTVEVFPVGSPRVKEARLGGVSGTAAFTEGTRDRLRDTPCERNFQTLASRHPDLRGVISVGSSFLPEALRGKGMGLAAYRLLVEHAGKMGLAVVPHYCDTGTPLTSEDALRVWDKLAQVPGFDVEGHVVYAPPVKTNPRRTRRARTAPPVLDPRHAALVATPAFKRWFRDSKVVSESGEPLVVYHGSPDIRHVFGGMTTFRSPPAFFATDVYGVANTYTPKGVLDYQNSEPGVIPLFVSMQNPMVIDARGARFRKTEHYVHQAYRDGHDGIIILNSVDDYLGSGGMGLATVYAWFDPRQAKSAVLDEMRSRIDGKALSFATPNSGNFDPTNPDIRMNPRRRNPSMVDMSANLPSMAWLRKNATVDIEEGGAFFDAKERVQEIAEENGEEPPEDEELEEAVWDYLGDVVYADFALDVRRFTNPIRIFRAVALANGVGTLRTHELGVYWTWDKYAAEPYWGGTEHLPSETQTFVIEALVAPADVNWESTLIANMTRPGEKEVTLLEGAPVQIVAVYDDAWVKVRGAFDARANPHRKRRR